MRGILTAIVLSTTQAMACDTALLLTIDVSNSIDVAEYKLQTDGMADAVLDAEVMEAMIQGQVAVAVMQWSGEGRQEVSIPWRQIRSPSDARAFATDARTMPRAFVMSDTAIGDAIHYALDQFANAPSCDRQVIDISGDGTPNAGSDTRTASREAERRGVTINGIAIESMGIAITTFFGRAVITRDGFVITARRHLDYPRAIREKILREVSRVFG
jgi:Ca-activated chloride channel family protein